MNADDRNAQAAERARDRDTERHHASDDRAHTLRMQALFEDHYHFLDLFYEAMGEMGRREDWNETREAMRGIWEAQDHWDKTNDYARLGKVIYKAFIEYAEREV